MATKKTLGGAIIGAGVIFKDHARAFNALADRTRLIGIAELDKSKLDNATSAYFAPVATTDYHELLERDDVDIVSVCTPPKFHEPIVIDALRAGKYVICEKPLAQSLASLDRIADVANEFPNRLGTVFQLRWLPEIEQMIWLRENGMLGKLLFGSMQSYGYLQGTAQSNVQWWGNWETAGGGVVATKFIHQLDLLLHVFGDVDRVSAWMGTLKNPIQSEDSFSATIEFKNGAVVVASASLAAHHNIMMKFDVMGEKVSVHYPWSLKGRRPADISRARKTAGRKFAMNKASGKAKKVINLARKVAGRISPKFRPPPPPPLHAKYLASVLDAIENGDPLPVPVEEARKPNELFTAIYESAITESPVSLPLDRSCRFYEGISPGDYDGASTPENVASGQEV